MSVALLIELLTVLARATPEIAAFVRSLLDGDPSAVERLRAVLPQESATERWEREHRDVEPPFRGVLTPEVVVFPPEYEE